MRKLREIRKRYLLFVLLAAAAVIVGLPAPGADAGARAGVEMVSAAEPEVGDTVKIRFQKATGKGYFRDLQITAEIGDTVTLPRQKGYQWRLNEDHSFSGGSRLKLSPDAEWIDALDGNVLTLRAEKIYYVQFYNKNGSTNRTLKSMKLTVASGDRVRLPEVPKVKGYTNLGWSTKKNADTADYKEKRAIRVTRNIKLYAVRKKSETYTVSFYMPNGRSNSTYRKLQVTAESGSYITLPEVPDKSGYVGLGWSTKRNSSSSVMKVGGKYKVTKNIKLYAVQSTAVTVTLCKNDGSTYRIVTLGKGNYLTLPSVANASGYTFLGWSRTVGKTTDPEYEAGGRIRVNASVKLYAVVFDRSREPDLTESNMARVDLWKQKYKQIIFVGDSRTVRMERTLEQEFGASSTVTWNVNFIARSGKGLDWLKSDGYTELMSIVNKNTSVQKPTAVIFNLGVNDLQNLADYVTYMDSLAPELQAKNCELFYMSVNPGNSRMMENTGHHARDEAVVRQFNSTIRSRLSGNYTYIDTYSWLMKNGYGTNASSSGKDNSVDDGLHYTTKTYKRIYYYCLWYLLNHELS